MNAHAGPAPWMQYAVPAVILCLVLGLRLWRMRGERRLRLATLWILPAIYAVGVAAVFTVHPPSLAGFAASAGALAVGAAIGWYRGTMMKISVDPVTHALSQRASPASALLLVGLLLVRRVAFAEFGGQGSGALLAVDVAMAFALGLIAVTRIEMALRARRLLAEARAAGLSRTFA